MIPLGCVTGRFQPVHEQHLELFGIALAQCRHLIVAVTNADSGARTPEAAAAHRHTAQANPFTYFERARLIAAAMAQYGFADRYTLVPFDFARGDLWTHYVPLSARHFVRAYGEWERQKAQRLSQAGYEVILLEGDPSKRVSAGAIRDSLRRGDDAWRPLVPAATRPLLDEWLA